MNELNLSVIALNVRVARARKKMTIIELSKKSGVGLTTISFVENAKKKVRFSTLERLAIALDTTVEELIKE